VERVVIFDLSEVLIAGLLGVEHALADRLAMRPEVVLSALGSNLLHQLCRGELTEGQYLNQIITREGWDISADEIKPLIRENFHRRVAGMDEVLNRLSSQYELFLLSDHAQEWVDYIRKIHPFLEIFKRQFYSFEFGQIKQETSTFEKVLGQIKYAPRDCLFIDDSAGNIRSAGSVGIEGIQFRDAEQLVNALTERRIL
jgi:FMN phosphatase YigB (HAD superfamily)